MILCRGQELKAKRLAMKEHREQEDEMRPEYDLRGGVRGKYRKPYSGGTNTVLLDPDLGEIFRDSESVNQALRIYLREHGRAP